MNVVCESMRNKGIRNIVFRTQLCEKKKLINYRNCVAYGKL